MSATWIPVGNAVAIILLGLSALEVMSAGVRVVEPAAAARTLWEARPPSGLTPDDLLTLDLRQETAETMRSADRDDH